MNRILLYLKGQKSLLVFLFIASAMWLATRLSHQYTTTLSLEIEIVEDYSSESWIKDSRFKIDATISGQGGKLLLYKLGLSPRIEIKASQLEFIPASHEGDYQIEPSSMLTALQNTSSALSFISLHSLPQMTIVQMQSKRVAIISKLDFSCQAQYMILDGVQISRDSIGVRGPKLILDTLYGISTKTLIKENLHQSVQGSVNLVLPENIYAQNPSVDYSATVVSYTEIKQELPITVVGKPSQKALLMLIPSTTTIRYRMPLMDSRSSREPIAYIDYRDAQRDPSQMKSLEVKIDSLPFGAELLTMDPAYITPLFEDIEQ